MPAPVVQLLAKDFEISKTLDILHNLMVSDHSMTSLSPDLCLFIKEQDTMKLKVAVEKGDAWVSTQCLPLAEHQRACQ